MRLISNVPIFKIQDVLRRYHQDSFGQAKQLVVLGEQLKSTEQRYRASAQFIILVLLKKLLYSEMFSCFYSFSPNRVSSLDIS